MVPKSGRRFNVNMLSAISPKSRFRFMVTGSRINADVLIDFPKRLLYDAKWPVFLIVDCHPTLKAKKVKKFINGTKGKLTLFYLPTYSPEFNPDELVWNHVESHHLDRAGLGREQGKTEGPVRVVALGGIVGEFVVTRW